MSGKLVNGVCSHCGKMDEGNANRPGSVLPDRYLLCDGRYYLGRVLGLGGYGITYLARDMKLGRKVAVKEFYPKYILARQYPATEVYVSDRNRNEFQHAKMRFEQEARIIHELRNVPEIVNVYHLFEENGTAYYVMEYLEGIDMKNYLLRNGVLQWQQLCKPIGMILKALYYVHEKRLIHRDISPDNLFMLPDGGIKLIDFGNARNYTAAAPMTMILKSRFAPVEQYLDGKDQGPWTDIYSLSVTIYYALSGKLPAASQDRLVSMRSGGDPVVPLASLKPDIPQHVSDAVSKGMAVLPEERYRTVSEFWAGLFPGQAFITQEKIYTLRCTGGILQGTSKKLVPGEVISLGRGREAAVVYPAGSCGVSRTQCSVMMDKRNEFYVRDDNSSYGTKLNGEKLIPMYWCRVEKTDRISFAGEEYLICEESENG